jgi:hypothetical protein
MSKLLVLMLSLIIVSCSKPSKENSSSNSQENSEEVIVFAPINVSIPNTGIMANPITLDFASLAFKQVATQEIIITNNSAIGSLTYSASDFDTSLISPFVISSNTCIASIGSRSKCKIVFTLSNSASLASEQNLTSLFKIKGVDVNLTGILQADATDYNAPIASISVSPSELNFGQFKVGEFRELNLVVKNNSTIASPIVLTTLSNSNITMVSNTCTSSLSARRTCAIKLKYTGANATTKTTEDLFKVSSHSITHSVVITSPSEAEPEVLDIDPVAENSSVPLTQPNIQNGTIRFTNKGTIALKAPVSAISSNAGVEISSISCVGGLQRSKTCDVNYIIRSSSAPAGVSVQSIRLQSGTIASDNFNLNLNITPNASACTVADAQSNGVSITNSNSTIMGQKTGSDVSQCFLASNACNQYYAIASDDK